MTMKTIEQCEREFSNAVQEFINAAVAKGHSLDSAKVMARDAVARAVRKTFKVVSA